MRKWINRQLDVEIWPGDGLSPANAAILVLILVNLACMVLRTEPTLTPRWSPLFDAAEALSLAAFTLEYVLRVWSCVENPRYAGPRGRLRYAVSFYATVDLLAILPSYVAWGGADLTWMRVARLMRVLKVARFGGFALAVDTLRDVFRNRRYELIVSAMSMLALVLAAAVGLWAVEGDLQPDAFGSVPRAMWWAVETLTTVGYGDVSPTSVAGKLLAAIVSLAGIALVAIPTGILAASFTEIVQERKERKSSRPGRGRDGQ